MTRTRGAAMAATLLGVAAAAIATAGPSTAQVQPITAEPLTGRAVFTDDVDIKFRLKHHGEERVVVNAKNPSRTFVQRYTLQPGARFPWHTHPGSVVVNVTQGELVYVAAEGCEKHSYPAGTAFFDSGHGHVHSAYNPTNAPTIIVATFYEAPPAPEPLLTPVDAPADCQF